MSLELMKIWTVYERPDDYPNGYLARLWLVTSGDYRATDTVIRSDTLDGIEAFFVENYPHLTYLPRHDDDDLCILGTWL